VFPKSSFHSLLPQDVVPRYHSSMIIDRTSLANLAAAASAMAHHHGSRTPDSGSRGEASSITDPSMKATPPSATSEATVASPAPVSRSSSGADEEESVDDDVTPSSTTSTCSTQKRKNFAVVPSPLLVESSSLSTGYVPVKKRVKGDSLAPSTGEEHEDDGQRSGSFTTTSTPSSPTTTSDAADGGTAKEKAKCEAKEALSSSEVKDKTDNQGNDEEEILSIVRDELSADDKKIQGQNVVGTAFLKLANLCDMNDRGKRNAAFFLDTIGVGSIILLMKKTPGNPKIQGCGAALLLNLMNLTANAGRVKEAIHRMGGLEVIASAIHALPHDEKVQLYGCAVLQKWTRGGNDEKKALVNAHGIEAFVSALKKHRKDVRIQRLGCKALSTLCLEKEYLPRVSQAGGFSALIAAGERYPTDPIASVSALNAARQYLMLNNAL
jgi:hypothetical protein